MTQQLSQNDIIQHLLQILIKFLSGNLRKKNLPLLHKKYQS